jgi:flagellin-like hook-associated protein FlgL
MTAQLRGISAAVRNAHDGLSVLETAEGGLNTISNAIQRMRELAVQSANSTNNSNDRANLNLEAKQLSAEIDRVASSTTFNGIKLLDGSFQNKRLQIGPDSSVNDSISISIDSAKISSLGFGASTTSTSPTTTYAASTSGSPVGSTALNLGDLSINGFSIGAVISPSAKDVSAAINLLKASTGVSAIARATVADSISISTPSTTASDTPGAVSISVSPNTVSEIGTTNLNYTFTRSGDTSQELTVNVNLGGTATSADFTTTTPIASSTEPVKVWTRMLGTSSDDRAFALTTGLDGFIYVSGYTDGSLAGPSNSGYRDAFVTKYAPDGTKVWTRQLGSSDYDEAWALTTGLDGSIYVSGYTTRDLDGQINSGREDAFITKFTSDGNKVWTQLIGNDGFDQASASTTGLDGSIYVSGNTFMSKFNPDGTQAWTRTQSAGDFDYLNNKALTTGTDGSIFGASGTFVTKYAPDGTIVWKSRTGDVNDGIRLWALTPGLDGSIYVSGSTWGMLDGQPYVIGGGFDAFITKFNADGTKAWTREQGTYDNDHPYGLTTGSDGSIYVTGRAGTLEPGSSIDRQPYNWVNQTDVFITKYNPDGTKDWTRLLTSSGQDEPRALTTGLDGAIYVSGYTNGSLDGQTNSGSQDAFLTKFSVSPQVTFAAGSSTTTLVVAPTSDALSEGSETLTLNLLQGSGYSVGTASATGTIVDGAAFTFNAISSGAIQINRVNIGAIATAATSSERATQMLTAINAQTANTGVAASLNTTTGGINLTAADGRNIELSTLTSANISGSAIGIALNGTTSGSRTVTTFRSSVDLTSTSANGLSIVATDNGATASGLSTSTIAATVTSTPGNNSASSQTSTSELDLSTVDGSTAAITLLDVALNKLTNTRATLGAFQNRLLAAIQNLDTTAMNLAASRSRILDTDYAVETANLAKAQIIQEASMAMLAQANQSNQSVLALLKS